jgi:hypothetical protein
VSLPATIDDHPAFADRLAEVVAGVLGQVDLDSVSLRVESAASDEFVLALGGRPALLGLSTAAADQDVLLDEISLRLLRRLELWEPDGGPLRGVNDYLAQLGMGPHTRVTSDEPVIVVGSRRWIMHLTPSSSGCRPRLLGTRRSATSRLSCGCAVPSSHGPAWSCPMCSSP